MALQHDQEAANLHRDEVGLTEDSPLLRPMSPKSAGALCTCTFISILAVTWCLVDFFSRRVSDDLFDMGDIHMFDISRSPDFVPVVSPFKTFAYPLTLAFLQFVFMGMVFLSMYFAVTQSRPSDLRGIVFSSDRRWPALVISHILSTFWLQSLMLPSQAMSLSFFASTRAFEIPAAALMRPPVLGQRLGKKAMQTTAFAFGASCLMYFSYAQLAGCVCILSGNGVALTGLVFWIVYALVLAMPAANAVYQEAIMLHPGMHPLLILALQNIFASLLFGPVLLICHFVGWEDIGGAFQMILSNSAVFMVVMWLCAALAVTSVVNIMLIHICDAFWAIALRPIRVVFWGMITLINFYMASDVALSIESPRSSFWCLMILCGCGLAATAIYTDRKEEDNFANDKALAGSLKAAGKSNA